LGLALEIITDLKKEVPISGVKKANGKAPVKSRKGGNPAKKKNIRNI